MIRCLRNRMRISYRVTSIAVVLIVVGMIMAPEPLMVRPRFQLRR